MGMKDLSALVETLHCRVGLSVVTVELLPGEVSENAPAGLHAVAAAVVNFVQAEKVPGQPFELKASTFHSYEVPAWSCGGVNELVVTVATGWPLQPAPATPAAPMKIAYPLAPETAFHCRVGFWETFVALSAGDWLTGALVEQPTVNCLMAESMAGQVLNFVRTIQL